MTPEPSQPFQRLHARHPQTLDMTETLQMLDDVQVEQVAAFLNLTPRNAMILQIAQIMVDGRSSLERLDQVISQFDDEAMRRSEERILKSLEYSSDLEDPTHPSEGELDP